MFSPKPSSALSYAVILHIRLNESEDNYTLKFDIGRGKPIEDEHKSFYFITASGWTKDDNLGSLLNDLDEIHRHVNQIFSQNTLPVERIDLRVEAENIETLHLRRNNLSITDALTEYNNFMTRLTPLVQPYVSNHSTRCTVL